MAKFTPGPWKNAGLYIIDPDHKNIIAGIIRKLGYDDEVEANGRLIAAAPEMYELLKEELIPTSDYGGILSFSRENKLRKLLARIDGEASNE